MKKLYFGHPVNVYNAPLENQLIKTIGLAFPEWEIENPNQQKHQDGYKKWTAKTGRGMDYYFQEVLPQMNGGIFLPFIDGKFGAGVFGEAENLFKANKKIWTINHQKIVKSVQSVNSLPFLSVDETRQRIYVAGKRENGIKSYFD
jgi:hypothetical protein